jgi:hypothetical protein
MRKNCHILWRFFTALPFFLSLFCFFSGGCSTSVPETMPQLVVIDCNTGIIHTVGDSRGKLSGPQFQLPELKEEITEEKQ